MIKLSKSLKKPLEKVASLMPTGFTNQMFIDDFKILYSYIWDDLESKYTEYKRMDEGLIRKGFSERYFFPSPADYIIKRSHAILSNTRFNHSKGVYLSDDEISSKREILIQESNKKIVKRREKLEENLQLVQEVTPTYTNYFISEYFTLKRNKPDDVTSRYVLLQEASKYKCNSTITFLHKVNSSERNFQLKQFAFLTLQKFGKKEVRLRKNRKGKKRSGDKLIPAKIESPSELLNHIYNSQLEQNKKYDLFLSHSSNNKELLLTIKSTLNSLDFNVYIDWINDKEGLKRTLTNVATAQVIIERLKSSDALMFVYTEESLNSLWTPWEIGYFHSSKGKICVYYPEMVDESKIPAFINIYPKVFLDDNSLFVEINGGKIPFNNWIAL
ncbi:MULTISPECIES: toll/interleukin-1 receptor domain-containing protein [Weeksellaceae]|uniref:toll/interleukin-1 receptor domain-containing protein n=1 Tax=Weeksellaceae TaxID=2762318 RepID=UPI001C86EA80|nr:toll/interleukin-1 receptor domain-containing protein [Elizabethkingia bruuniana]